MKMKKKNSQNSKASWKNFFVDLVDEFRKEIKI